MNIKKIQRIVKNMLLNIRLCLLVYEISQQTYKIISKRVQLEATVCYFE